MSNNIRNYVINEDVGQNEGLDDEIHDFKGTKIQIFARDIVVTSIDGCMDTVLFQDGYCNVNYNINILCNTINVFHVIFLMTFVDGYIRIVENSYYVLDINVLNVGFLMNYFMRIDITDT